MCREFEREQVYVWLNLYWFETFTSPHILWYTTIKFMTQTHSDYPYSGKQPISDVWSNEMDPFQSNQYYDSINYMM
jgi:hypothetical protein